MPRGNVNHNAPLDEASRMSRRMINEQARQGRELSREFFFNPFLSWQRQINSIMADTIENFSRMPQVWSLPMPLEKVMPKVDVWEDSEAFYLQTKVPGMDISDIDISVSDNAMTITCGSEKVSEQTDKGETLYQKHNACRTVMIPANANADKAQAEMRGEDLIIKMPKKKEQGDKGKKISVRKAA